MVRNVNIALPFPRWKPRPPIPPKPPRLGQPTSSISCLVMLSDVEFVCRRTSIQVKAMHSDAIGALTVQVALHGDKYAWKLYSDGHYHPIKFSVPIFLSADAAHAAGHDVRARYLVRLARSAARRPRIKRTSEIKAA